MKKRWNFLPITCLKWDIDVVNNLNKIRLDFFVISIFMLILIVLFLFREGALSVNGYINIQKESFLFINSKLSFFPNFEYNLTQLGDVIIFLPFLALFMVYVPKLWKSILTGLIVSWFFSSVLKTLFAIPRPAMAFDRGSFLITGKALVSHTSLPSGHSIVAFAILTCILFAFMPTKLKFKIPWIFVIFTIGSIIVFSRVAIGAHYPLDVIIGSIIGYISALLGIFINRWFHLLDWLTTKKYYFISMLLFSIWAIAIINKILTLNLMIFYFALVSLFVSLFIIIHIYVKKAY